MRAGRGSAPARAKSGRAGGPAARGCNGNSRNAHRTRHVSRGNPAKGNNRRVVRTALIATLAGGLACLATVPGVVRAQDDGARSQAQLATPANGAAVPGPSGSGLESNPYAAIAGQRVHDIQFRGVPPILDRQRLIALIPQKADEPLDKRKLRDSIQALYATGRFQDIQVEAEPSPGNELSLVFTAKPSQFVGPVSVTGAPRGGPSDHQLLNASKLQLGELLTDDLLAQAMAGMKRILEDNGYYRATITPRTKVHEDTQQVEINFLVEPDAHARIGNISVSGDSGYNEEEIEDIAKLHSGDPVSVQAVTRALQRLRKRFQKQNRLEAQVSLVRSAYQPETNRVDYVLHIERGPVVKIHVEGARLAPGVIKKNVPVYEENAVDDDLLNEGRRNLRDYLQTQGYFDAQVAVTRNSAPEKTDIVYDVDKGGRHKLLAIALEGNKYFPEDLLRDHMRIQPAGWLLSHGLFSQSLLNRDVETIQNLYQANGFQQAKVEPEVDDNYLGQRGQMRVVLHIDEGTQVLVKQLTIEGNKTFPETELRNLLANAAGQPFSDANMVTDHETLVTYYFNRGFPDVAVNYSSSADQGDPTRRDVTYTISEGQRVYVNQVLISGLHFTRPFVVNQQVVTHPGDPLSQADLISTQSRLYDLGIFNAVDVAVQNPEGKEPSKDVLLNLTEARRYTFDYGLGFEVQTGSVPSGTSPQGRTGASPRVSFDANRLNFRGRNDTIFFKSHFGRLQQRALLGYEVPRWLNQENLKLTFNTFYDNTLDVFTFTSRRLEGSAQVEQTISKATTLLYRLTYRDVRVSNLQINLELAPLFSRPERIAMPSFTFIRDTRDDPVDSHKGNYLVFDTGVARGQQSSAGTSNVGSSSANFGRFLLQHSEYLRFGRKGRFVLAHSTKLGIEQPWGTSAVIPLPERFFAGGGNSLRGFAINEAGPRDAVTGFQLGGEAMVVNNLELRLPPVPLPFLEKDLSPVFFHDMGNVFSSPSDVFPSLFRWKERTECTATICNFNYMSHALGGGIRYRTPIGPVRFDVSYNLNPPVFLVGGQSQTLHRVNFFFSIGQTF
jgi:outer membrane protein insertion porin family